MKRLAWISVFPIGVVAAIALAGDAPKTSGPEPFYWKYLQTGDPLDDKIIAQEKRVEEHPEDPNLHNDLGNLLAERHFGNDAAAQYEKALKLDKGNFISAYNLGLVRETQGHVHEAIAAYEKAIKRRPGFPQARFRLGRLYEHTNQPEPAVKEYAAALWIDPALRDPKRNPLVVDCELIYLASLANYPQNVAVAAMTESNIYFDTDRFRKLPTNRSIGSKEVEGEAPAETVTPRDVGAPMPPGATGASEPARHGPRTGAAAPQPAGATGAPPPGMVGAPPPGMLAPGDRPTPVPRRPGVTRPQPVPSAAPAPAAPPPETVEPTPVPEVPPESPQEVSPETEPSF